MGFKNRSQFRDENVKMREVAQRNLKKAKEYEATHKLYRYRFPNGLEIAHVSKERLVKLVNKIAKENGYKIKKKKK